MTDVVRIAKREWSVLSVFIWKSAQQYNKMKLREAVPKM